MDPVLLIVLFVFLGIIALVALVAITARLYRKVPQGQALVVNTMRKVDVTFTGKVVVPIFHKAEIMDISVKVIDIDRRGADGLVCRDNIRADIGVKFYVQVKKQAADVLNVAQSIGCDRASDPITLDALFTAKFAEALKTAGKQFDYIDLYTHRSEFRTKIIEIVGSDLNGYVLDDCAIDHLEQTPVGLLDRNNILDAQGIRKITELTSVEHIATNEAQNEETKLITKKNVETREATLELERQQAEAEVRKAREIEAARAREAAATQIVQAEEKLRAEQARIDSDQKIAILDENRQREIQVAAKNRERVLAVEAEKVEKARQVEVVQREVETTAAQRSLEEELRTIAELKRERVAVEKTVAEQEESISTLRVVEEANRQKEASVRVAEGEAEGAFVKDIKAAEARATAAQHEAKEKLTLATADRDAAQLEAEAKVRLAEGVKAEAAAPGLAEAAVITERGVAEAGALEAKLKGEAAGLADKADAMAALQGATKDHEEFRLRLDAETRVRLAAVDAQRGIATAQAEAVKAGLEGADIDIVGGSDLFVDRIANAAGQAKALDALVTKSDVAGAVLEPYTNGERSLVGDAALALGAIGTDGVRDLTLTAFLHKLMQGADSARSAQLAKVAETLDANGLGNVAVRELLGM